MESTAEINDAMESSAEAHHLKRKESEGSAEAPNITRRSDHEEQPAEQPPRSPEMLVEALTGNAPNFNPGSSSEPGMAVEELTLGNYKGPSMFAGEGSMVKKGLWSNFTRLSGDSGDARSLNHLKVSDYLAESENRVVSRNADGKPMDGIRTKVLPASGFHQFVVRNDLQGKGVAHRLQGNFKKPHTIRQPSNVEVDSISSSRVNERVADKVLVGGGKGLVGSGNDLTHDTQSDGISLREWINPRGHKVNKFERLHLFKQVLEIVDISHSQGLVLQDLRPSHFSVSPSNVVKYVGSFIPQRQMEQLMGSTNHDINHLESHSKRKRYLEYGNRGHGNLSPKHQKHDKLYSSTWMLGCAAVSSSSHKHSMNDHQNLEERWYASPEELHEGICSFSSNIYSVGVLFFELFCCFETWEVLSAAMSDLRYRILPPSFLSESSKEAGFCLWLLHPEPSSRPNSRNILQSDLICEGRDVRSLDQSSASIEEENAEADLLLHFLLNLREQKEKHAAKLGADVECLKSDIQEVERRYSSGAEFLSNTFSFKDMSDNYPLKQPSSIEGASRYSGSHENELLMRNIDQLENAYFSLRSKVEKVELPELAIVARLDTDVLKIRDKYSRFQNDDDMRRTSTDPLGSFFGGLCKYARYSKFEVCGSIRSVDILNSANVICSLSFDRDEDYFAAAGVSKKIKIFEFGALLKDNVDTHYPLIEMSNRSKLSCVSWNNYIKNYLASTDYEGVVQLWDASTGQGFTQYTEHQKRAWCVDFSVVDPTKLASGSDDCSVKLWSINESNCIDTVRNVANVCCVQFSSDSSHLLAFGSADYKIYCFDLRHTRSPWCTLAGHAKAVSYVKFVDSDTVVSASTDNTLKLWDLKKTSPSGLSTNACSLTLNGHTNEKNFVGLSVSDGYITCGSETNEVYSYYKTLPMPITCHKFGSIDPITGQDTVDDSGQFVSSVCWRSKSNMVVAANSTGRIEVLRML